MSERNTWAERVTHWRESYGFWKLHQTIDERMALDKLANEVAAHEHLEEIHHMLWKLCEKNDIDLDETQV